MNPVHLMPGVEVVRTDLVDETVFSWTMKVLEKMGKIPFPAHNVPGFIVNKLYVPLALDTIRLVFRGEAEIATIDQALKLSLGHPQGGLILADRIGHDVMIDVSNELYTATQDPRFVVPPEYMAMREAGNLGFKSGRGFYDWTEDPRNPTPVPLEELGNPVK
jgi:3-hydroxybutyryl-CoA dehydrogenase